MKEQLGAWKLTVSTGLDYFPFGASPQKEAPGVSLPSNSPEDGRNKSASLSLLASTELWLPNPKSAGQVQIGTQEVSFCLIFRPIRFRRCPPSLGSRGMTRESLARPWLRSWRHSTLRSASSWPDCPRLESKEPKAPSFL